MEYKSEVYELKSKSKRHDVRKIIYEKIFDEVTREGAVGSSVSFGNTILPCIAQGERHNLGSKN